MDYRQAALTGTQYTRFSYIGISNPRNGQAKVNCTEQTVFLIGGKVELRDSGYLNFNFSPTESFPILNPSTNEPTGATALGSDAYALIYSYVLHEAAKRDAQLAAP